MDTPPKTRAVFRRVNFALGGQLARRSQHEGARSGLGVVEQAVEQGQRERGRLAGAGLREAQHVGAFERGGDGLGLDGPG
jgi:hypothetical protein